MKLKLEDNKIIKENKLYLYNSEKVENSFSKNQILNFSNN